MDLKILYYYGFPITSLTEHTLLKLTNQYHPNAKSSLEYLPQGSSLSPILICIYLLPLSKLIKSFPTVKYNIYAEDIEIHADCHQSSNIHLQAYISLLLLTGSPRTIYYLIPIRLLLFLQLSTSKFPSHYNILNNVPRT